MYTFLSLLNIQKKKKKQQGGFISFYQFFSLSKPLDYIFARFSLSLPLSLSRYLSLLYVLNIH